jgi:hypothetical protein
MKRPSKKKVVLKPQAVVPPGRILEMRPMPQKKAAWNPAFIVILIIAVAGVTASVLSLKRMSETVFYADRAVEQLAAIKARAADLENQVTDFETLQILNAKDAKPPIPSPDQTWTSYSSKNLSLQYPPGFEIVKATAVFPALTIKNSKGSLEIFRMKDFGGKREIGSDDRLPKTSSLVGTVLEDSRIQPYDAWFYYEAGDDATMAMLEGIAASVKALR